MNFPKPIMNKQTISLVLLSSTDSTHLAKEKALADAEFYKVQREAEANKVRSKTQVKE